jgi:hypothetical protein
VKAYGVLRKDTKFSDVLCKYRRVSVYKGHAQLAKLTRRNADRSRKKAARQRLKVVDEIS